MSCLDTFLALTWNSTVVLRKVSHLVFDGFIDRCVIAWADQIFVAMAIVKLLSHNLLRILIMADLSSRSMHRFSVKQHLD